MGLIGLLPPPPPRWHESANGPTKSHPPSTWDTGAAYGGSGGGETANRGGGGGIQGEQMKEWIEAEGMQQEGAPQARVINPLGIHPTNRPLPRYLTLR